MIFNSRMSGHDDWLTPPDLIKALGPFDMDPCVPTKMPWQTAPIMYDRRIDGYSVPWYGRVWLNPPYGSETWKWLERLSLHQDGLALIFARTDTKGFHEQVWQKADSIFFFGGRLRFYRPDGTRAGAANAPSCLVSYSVWDTEAIAAAQSKDQIRGHHVCFDRSL